MPAVSLHSARAIASARQQATSPSTSSSSIVTLRRRSASERLGARPSASSLAPNSRSRSRHVVRASEDEKPQIPPQPAQQDPNAPLGPSSPGSELPWVRREREEEAAKKAAASGEKQGPPFAVFLVASALVAIAAVGSVFEFVNKNAIFGVLPPSSPLYTPILGLFALTGLPSAGWLFFKAVQAANEEAERQDRLDGFK